MVSLLCFSCDHRNPIGSRFCNACGAPMNFRPCKHCGAINVRAAAHCHQCGETFDLAFLSDDAEDAAPVAAQPDTANGASPAMLPSPRSVAWQRIVPVTAVAVALAAVLVGLSPSSAPTAQETMATVPAAPQSSTPVPAIVQPALPADALPLPTADVHAVPGTGREGVNRLDAAPAAIAVAAPASATVAGAAPGSASEPLRIHTPRAEPALPVVRRDMQEAKAAPAASPEAVTSRSARREATAGSRRATSGAPGASSRREAQRAANQVAVTDGARPATRAKRPASSRRPTVASAEPLCPEGRMPAGGCDLRLPKGN